MKLSTDHKMKNSNDSSKILIGKKLQAEVKKLQKAGKKIVLANGCFDLLHLGHVSLFKKAKALGDVLIVAINSDNSIKRLKGPKRPLIGQKDRAKLLLSLKYIDYVTIFNEQTPKKILSELRPDILIKGADYRLSQIVGKEYVKKVYRFPHIKGRSSTNLIRLIVERYGPK
jgi:D-beta-D-heptose 7-phosphate kinase/D-beta-D-heptose 1-phosphate adenosyltransferase